MAVDSKPGSAQQELTATLGQVIDDRYRITAFIGDGGMGSVYRANHLGINRPVAVKLLHRDIAKQPGFSRRFEREAMVAGRTDHPNCVSVEDFGRLDDGTLYLVMELVSGVSLKEVIESEGALGVERSLKIARHILRGLAHLHQSGIIHRDVKPDNIILTEHEGEEDFAKILDFGIAKLVGEAALEIENNQLTQVGTTVGTPKYIPPEQAFGKKVDGRADLYSLSVVLYQMLAGLPPFDSPEVLELLMMHASRQPPPFRESAPEQRIPSSLEALVLKGMAKKPDQRVESAEQYLNAVEQILADLAIRPVSQPRTTVPTAAVHTQQPSPPSWRDNIDITLIREQARAYWFRLRWFVHQQTSHWTRLQVLAAVAAGGFLLVLALVATTGKTEHAHNAERGPSGLDAVTKAIEASAGELAFSPSREAEQARELNESGSYSETIRLLEDIDPNRDGYAAFELARAYAEKGRRMEAVETYGIAFKQVRALRNNETGTAHLEGWLRSRNRELRLAAATVLLRYGDSPRAANTIVELASEEKNNSLRHQARDVARRYSLDADIDWVSSYSLDLSHGKSCDDRREAVMRLRELEDASAIPALKRARKRMRGGVLGLGGKNTNQCLGAEAEETIAYLESL